VVLPLPDDTIIAAVSVKGSAFLAWVQQVLSVPPFFMQSAQVAIGRDPKREFDCQVNRLQVDASRAHLPMFACGSHLSSLRVQIENRTFAPTEVFRLVTTATLLRSAASQDILGNTTVAKAFQSPLDGIIDAVADAINARIQTPAQMPATDDPGVRFGIQDSVGEALNSACMIVCDAGTGVQVDDPNASTGSRPSCTPCGAGSHSRGGKAAECQVCLPGASFAMVYNGARHTAFWCAGFFQPEHGQLGCLSCDSLGDFYQEKGGQTSCQACAANTRRYTGLLSAANKSACQCKEGDVPTACLG
jgi:hypothetical protein